MLGKEFPAGAICFNLLAIRGAQPGGEGIGIIFRLFREAKQGIVGAVLPTSLQHLQHPVRFQGAPQEENQILGKNAGQCFHQGATFAIKAVIAFFGDDNIVPVFYIAVELKQHGLAVLQRPPRLGPLIGSVGANHPQAVLVNFFNYPFKIGGDHGAPEKIGEAFPRGGEFIHGSG